VKVWNPGLTDSQKLSLALTEEHAESDREFVIADCDTEVFSVDAYGSSKLQVRGEA
jgi:hypothetical protein